MSLKDSLNKANPNELADIFQKLVFGTHLRTQKVRLYRQVANQAPTDMIAAVHTLSLPDDAKASRVISAYARAGSGTAGRLTADTAPMSSATAAGHVNVSESGDITFAAADAWTDVDVEYEPFKVDVFTQSFPVVSNAIALPAKWTSLGLVVLMSASLDVGTVTGVGIVVAPGSAPATTKNVNTSLDRKTVQFRVADAVTAATLKVGIVPAVDFEALIKGSASPFVV